VCKTSIVALLDKLKALGVDRSKLPENVTEFFGAFGSERQNVIKACDFIRNSPLIGPRIPVHGLLLDISSGKLEWIVNGYDVLQSQAATTTGAAVATAKPAAADALGSIGAFKDFAMGEMKFPEMKIGELATQVGNTIAQQAAKLEAAAEPKITQASESVQQLVQQTEQYVKKGYAQPPPMKMRPSVLPPIKKKLPPPPPIRPGRDFGRG
jgi:hypothetical protein